MAICSWRTLLKEFWVLLCLCGNLLQISQISEIFFSYEVITIADVDYPKRPINAPTISFCFYISDMVKWDKVFEKFPEMKSHVGYKESMSMVNLSRKISKIGHLGKLNISSPIMNQGSAELLFSLTLEGEELFQVCSVVDPKTYRMTHGNCTSHFRIKTYFRECFKCFAFDELGTPEYDFRLASRILGINGVSFAIIMFPNIPKDRVNQAQIYYSLTNTLPRHGTASNVFVTDLNTMFFLTYQYFLNTLLPLPYETMCRNYTEDGFENKGDCYENCARNKSLQVFDGSLFPGPAVEIYRKDKLLSIFGMHGDAYIKMQKIQLECDNQCQAHDCEEKIFIPQLLNTQESSINTFLGFFQRIPTVRTTFLAKMPIIEFLTQVTSTFGFWTGISLYGVFELIDDLIKQFKEWAEEKKEDKIPSLSGIPLSRESLIQPDSGTRSTRKKIARWSPHESCANFTL